MSLALAEAWIHGARPTDLLDLDAVRGGDGSHIDDEPELIPILYLAYPCTAAQHLAALRRDPSQQRVFEQLVQRWLLDNPHRLTLAMVPDPDLDAKARQQEAALLAAVRTGERQRAVVDAAP